MDKDFIDMCYKWTNPTFGLVYYCQEDQYHNNWNDYNWEDMEKKGYELFQNCEQAKKISDTLSNLSPMYQQMKEDWDSWIQYCGIAGYNYNRCAFDYLHGNRQQAEEELNIANGNIVVGQDRFNKFMNSFTQQVPGANANPPANIPPGFNPIRPPNLPTP